MTNLTFFCQLYMKLIVLFFRLFFFSMAHYKKHHIKKLQNFQVCVWHLLHPVLKASHPLAEENKTDLFSTRHTNMAFLFSVFALVSISWLVFRKPKFSSLVFNPLGTCFAPF